MFCPDCEKPVFEGKPPHEILHLIDDGTLLQIEIDDPKNCPVCGVALVLTADEEERSR